MTIITVSYEIMEIGKTKNLIHDRVRNPDIFCDCDDETLKEEIDNYSDYYKIKFLKYPIIGLDIDGLSLWAKNSNYISLATEEEKKAIRWDGTKAQLVEKKPPAIMLRKNLTKWVKRNQIIDKNTGLITSESPIIPQMQCFYKILDYGPDKYEWVFRERLDPTRIYYYQRVWRIDPIAKCKIEPKII